MTTTAWLIVGFPLFGSIIIGLLFNWLRLRSGSLVAPVLLHLATNSVGRTTSDGGASSRSRARRSSAAVRPIAKLSRRTTATAGWKRSVIATSSQPTNDRSWPSLMPRSETTLSGLPSTISSAGRRQSTSTWR